MTSEIAKMSDSSLQTIVFAAGQLLPKPPSTTVPEKVGDSPIDAILWELSIAPAPPRWPEIPLAYVDVQRSGALPNSSQKGFLNPSEGPPPAHLIVDEQRLDEAAEIIARWIRQTIGSTLTVAEHRMLEVVLSATRKLLAEDRLSASTDDVAQLRAAADTIEIQIRTARPSRRVLSWAIGQIINFPGGVLSGVAATYLPELLHKLT